MTMDKSVKNQRLGKSIKAVRLMRGLSQETLAKAVGIEQNFLSRIEVGRRAASLETLQKIAEVLGINYAVLILFSEMDAEDLKTFKSATLEHIWEGEVSDEVYTVTRTQ